MVSITIPPVGRYVVDPRRSSISFATRHFFGTAAVRGTFGVGAGTIEVAAPVEQSRVSASIDAASFTTGNKQRDAKVRSRTFLHVGEHPHIEFASTAISRTDDDRLRVDGLLTVRGAQAPAELIVDSATQDGDTLTISASTVIDRYAHGVTALKGMTGRRLQLNFAITAVSAP